MDPKASIGIPTKIAVAATVILLLNAAASLILGDRQWRGLETLIAAADLTPLSALFWPLFEMGGYVMLFGIDYARQAIWKRRQKELAEARAEGYQIGYEAGAAEERQRINDANGHNWMFGGPDEYRR